jgi:thiamine-phosphate diphosphorylase
LGVGAIYQTSSKPDAGAPVGTGLIRELRQASDLPLVGIGGINRHNAAEVMAAGADGVAVISAILAAAQPRLEAAAIVKAGLNNMGE